MTGLAALLKASGSKSWLTGLQRQQRSNLSYLVQQFTVVVEVVVAAHTKARRPHRAMYTYHEEGLAGPELLAPPIIKEL